MRFQHNRDHVANPLDDAPVAAARGDGIDRRGFLKCMAWAGTAVVWTVSGVSSRRAPYRRPPLRTRETSPSCR